VSTSPSSDHFTDDESASVMLVLDADQWHQLTQLMEQPDDHIGALLGDPDLQVAIARADVVPRLLGWFTPDTPDEHGGRDRWGWSYAPERSGTIGASAVVEWSFAGTYTEDGNGGDPPTGTLFNGVLRLDQPAELHGVTFMGVEGGEFRLRRYIDWIGFYAQLGLTVNWRTPSRSTRARES
jgi:hypothetical protein